MSQPNHPAADQASPEMQEMRRQAITQFMQSFADFELSTKHRIILLERAGVSLPQDVMQFCYNSLVATAALVEPDRLQQNQPN